MSEDEQYSLLAGSTSRVTYKNHDVPPFSLLFYIIRSLHSCDNSNVV
jgi:hypothetical protein